MAYNIVVLVKQVPDMNGVRVDRSTGKPVMSGHLAMNSADEIAVEEAIRIKEQHGGQITVISAGPPSIKDVIGRALAMGADNGIIVQMDTVGQSDSLAVASGLASAIAPLTFDLIIAGYSSDDTETAQVTPQVAELCGLPIVSSVIELSLDGSVATSQRDMEDGKQTVAVQIPVVISVIAGINEPRYPSLKGIMAAKKKPVESVQATGIGESRITWSEPYAPSRESSGIILQDIPALEAARQLVVWLKEEKLVQE